MHQLLAPGEYLEDFSIRPRDVPELGHHHVFLAGVLEHPGQQAEVVVLNEHKSRLIPGFIENGIGKDAVDLAVTPPVAVTKAGTMESKMAERPETLVCETIVVALLLLLGEPDAPQFVAGVVRRHHHTTILIRRFLVSVASPLGDPCAAAGHQNGAQGSGQAACGGHTFNVPVLVPVHEGLPIGNDNELPAREAGLDHFLKPFPGPEGRHGRMNLSLLSGQRNPCSAMNSAGRA